MSWRRFFRRTQWNRERRAELESYIQIATDENIARGMAPEEAREAARKKLGNRTLIREEIYQMNTVSVIDALGRDLRYAFRGMRRNPMFTAVAVITLALGIGANTAIFSVINGVLIKPLAYPEPESLVGVWHSAVIQDSSTSDFNLSPQMFAIYVENNRVFRDFGIWRNSEATVTEMGDPQQVDTLMVTQGVLRGLGVQPALGRWFSNEDDTPGTAETVLLSHGYWQRRFGGNPGVIGQRITIDSRIREVIGVMPADFSFQGPSVDLILPLRFSLSEPPSDFSYQGIARLESGISVQLANTDLDRMLPVWMDKYVRNKAAVESLRIRSAVRPLKNDVVGDVGQVLWVLMGTIGIVLLIACANVANLLLVRAEGRHRELAIRAALGAGRIRIARELIVESMTLGTIGGAAGLLMAYGGIRLLKALGPVNLPRLAEISIDLPVLAFTVVVSLVSGLLFGLIPVVKYAGPQLAVMLRSSGRGAGPNRQRHRSQNTLVVVQVALALVLLVGSGLMIRSFQMLRSVQPGFTSAGQLQTVRISIPEAQVPTVDGVTRMQNDILNRISATPGVSSVSFVSGLPMEEPIRNNSVYAEGKTRDDEIPPTRRMKFIWPGLFQTMGTPLLAGRDLTWTDIYEKREVVLVSENFAKETWGASQEALGKRVKTLGNSPWREVIGVVGDVFDDGVHLRAPGIVYWPARQQAFVGVARSVAFVIRSSRTGSENFLRDIQRVVASVNPDLPLARVQTLSDVYSRSMMRTSFTLVTLAIAGGMALVLGIIGIYGVIAYMVTQRRREIGIRLALGAQQGELQRMFVRHGLVLASIGVAIGLGAAAGLTRLMSSLLFGISPLDPLTFGAVALFLAAAAALASYLPARRASAVDSVEAMRTE